MNKTALLPVFILLFGCNISAQKATSQFNNLNQKGVIIDGYDPVAFYTENKPVAGDEKYNYLYEGATYHFSSAANLEMFKADPEKYKPQFGGWCAYAVSLGRVAPVDVNYWSVQDGRLLFQHNKRADDGWKKDPAGNLLLADKYWPEVSSEHGEQIRTDQEKAFYNNTDKHGVAIEGYDPVAYFTNNKPIRGSKNYEARFEGATYWFASQENADMFKDNSRMFAPLYGGFCGYAMSDGGRRRPVNPELFSIVDGNLILQHSKGAVELWEKDVVQNKQKADGYWPGVIEKHHGEKTKYD